MQKLYCYVDETGQDTSGRIFVVSVVVTKTERDELLKLCTGFEKTSGKGQLKWHGTRYRVRLRYLRLVLSDVRFRGILRYAVFRDTTDYDLASVLAIAKAVNVRKPSTRYSALVYVDGLAKAKRHQYGRELRKLGIPTRKIQGVARDQSNALVRLADAIAGFVRDVLESRGGEMRTLFEKARRDLVLIAV